MDAQARRGALALAALVVALGGLVWWASTSGKDAATAEDAGEAPVEREASVDASLVRSTGNLDRLSEAFGDLTILTDKSEEDVAKIVTVENIASALDVAHCGPACDAIKKHMADKEHFDFETITGEDLILPPKDTLETVAAGLTPAERAKVHEHKTGVVIHARSPVDKDQLAARTLFAVAAILAEKLQGIVYDETTRRIESAFQTKQRVITTPIGQSAWNPRDIVIQFYRQPDGTARLVTLGMGRFGAPDLSMRGASMGAGAMLVDVMNDLAAMIVAGKDALPLVVTRGNASASFAIADAEREQGDPDEFVEVSPVDASWEDVVEKLFGQAARSVPMRFDDELKAAAEKARKELPSVLKREGELFVWGPFSIPEDERADGGPEEEWLWVKVSTCDERACTGTLSNRPMYSTNIASGRTTSLPRAKIADWLLKLPDGGVSGGATTALVEKRR